MKLHRMTSGLTFILGSSEFLDGQITERRRVKCKLQMGARHWQRLGESLRLSETQATRYAGVWRAAPWVTGAAATGPDGCDMLECHGSSGSR